MSPHLHYFPERAPIPRFYRVHRGARAYAVTERISVLGIAEFCAQVGLI